MWVRRGPRPSTQGALFDNYGVHALRISKDIHVERTNARKSYRVASDPNEPTSCARVRRLLGESPPRANQRVIAVGLRCLPPTVETARLRIHAVRFSITNVCEWLVFPFGALLGVLGMLHEPVWFARRNLHGVGTTHEVYAISNRSCRHLQKTSTSRGSSPFLAIGVARRARPSRLPATCPARSPSGVLLSSPRCFTRGCLPSLPGPGQQGQGQCRSSR